MVDAGTAVTLIVVTLLALLALAGATFYDVSPVLEPIENDGHRG